MGSLFGKGEAAKGQKNLERQTAQFTKKGLAQLNATPILDRLDTERLRLQNNGITPFSSLGPGFGINISEAGDINMSRTPETQGFMNRLLTGLNTDESAFGDLLSQITPGFGRLTNARREELRRAQEKSVGNLRDQLARRRVAGASFANDQIGSLESEFAALTDKAISESMVEELKLTGDVIGARTQARNQTISQALSQIQFEGNIGASLTQSVLANMNNLQLAQVELAQTAAGIEAEIQKARAGVVTNLGTTQTGQASNFANIASQEAAGPGQLIGSVLGTGVGAFLGNPGLGFSLGSSLFGGGSGQP